MRLLLALMLLAPLAASGQEAASGTGRIVGIVLAPEFNEPLWGAHVRIDGTDIETASETNGVFVLDGVPAGEHVVRVSYIGFDVETIEKVGVRTGENTTIRVSLRASSLCECVVVLAEPEPFARGVYQARVVRHVAHEASCCSTWTERAVSPYALWEAR